KLKQVRVRDLEGVAKIEVDKEKISVFNDNMLNEITNKLKLIGFSSAHIDPEGYRPGKINVIID
ncbi:MAG: TIGR00268 family protein, partial [Nitrosarchaeum sp.]